MQGQIVPGPGGRSIQDAGDAPAGVRFYPFMPHCTMQRALVVGLYAQTPNKMACAVGDRVHPLKIGLGQTAYAPHGMGKKLPIRVMTQQSCFDFHPREAMAIHSHPGHGLRVQAQTQGNGLQGSATTREPSLKGLPLLHRKANERFQERKRGLEIFHPFLHHHEGKYRQVPCDQPTLTIVDLPPGRR